MPLRAGDRDRDGDHDRDRDRDMGRDRVAPRGGPGADPVAEPGAAPGTELRVERAPVPSSVLELLACPGCYQPLEQRAEGLRCMGCGRAYPVVEGIAVLLVDRATRPG